jgi:glycosyltransferase involved in cell wall biosynthesis
MTFFLHPRLHTRAKRIFFRLAMQISARRADALIADSESTRQDAIRLLGIPPQKIYTALLGVDEAYRPISDQRALQAVQLKYNLPADFILYVGLVEPRKNLPLLVRAFRNLIDLKSDIHLVLVGRFGWMYTEVLQLIDTLGVKDRVSLIGYVPSEDLPLVYNLARVFVYPTLYEGFGLPALEAMACGVPVITTEVSSLPEIVGDAGMLVPVNDETALTQAIQAVLTDQALRQQLVTLGTERASQFTWERTAQQTFQVYRHVLQAD